MDDGRVARTYAAQAQRLQAARRARAAGGGDGRHGGPPGVAGPGTPRDPAAGRPTPERPGGAWAGSTRKSRLPKNWAALRLTILSRDSYSCTWVMEDGSRCCAPANQVDHIIPNDNDDPTNLRALCSWHHNRKSSAEGAAARRPRLRNAREPDEHPGAYLD